MGISGNFFEVLVTIIVRLVKCLFEKILDPFFPIITRIISAFSSGPFQRPYKSNWRCPFFPLWHEEAHIYSSPELLF